MSLWLSNAFTHLQYFHRIQFLLLTLPVWLKLWKNTTSVFVTDYSYKKGNLKFHLLTGRKSWNKRINIDLPAWMQKSPRTSSFEKIYFNQTDCSAKVKSESFYLLLYSEFNFLEQSVETRRPSFLWSSICMIMMKQPF